LINILWNFVVYCSKISDISKLKTRLIDEWAQFDQSIVDMSLSSIGVVIYMLVSMHVWHTLSINSDSFETTFIRT